MNTCALSVIVAARNEGAVIARLLQQLQPLRLAGHEILLVDGGSRDDTCEQAQGLVDRLLHSRPGRSRQMNIAAEQARGEWFWFVHADSVVEEVLLQEGVSAMLESEAAWGRFDVRLDAQDWRFRVIETLMNTRSRLTGIATGDQGIFVRRSVFVACGGYPQLPLMEDVALSRLLKSRARPLCLNTPLVTSARRWQQRGIVRTVLLMWWLRLAFYLGVPADRLARHYSLCASPTHES